MPAAEEVDLRSVLLDANSPAQGEFHLRERDPTDAEPLRGVAREAMLQVTSAPQNRSDTERTMSGLVLSAVAFVSAVRCDIHERPSARVRITTPDPSVSSSRPRAPAIGQSSGHRFRTAPRGEESARFGWVYVFADAPVLGNARALADVIKERCPVTRPEVVEVRLADPTDYEAIFYELTRASDPILQRHAGRDPQYFISTASGTPQIQTVWFLLARSGRLPATLLKVTPGKFLRPGQRAVSEIRLSLAEFPKITVDDHTTLELASLRIQKEKLEAEREGFFRQIEIEGVIGRSAVLQDALKILLKAAPT